jgi:molybdenum cofactor cytidylyltransferase
MRKIGAVVLAAGGSSRLGRPKQLVTFRGETLIQRAVRAATEAECDPVVIIVGESELPGTDGLIVQNTEWRRGMGTSIRRGVERLPASTDAVVLLTCDQPFVDAAVIGRLIHASRETGKPIVASSYADTFGVPALFDRSCFDALRALPDGSGAKALILSRREDVAGVVFDRGAIDVDTPEDLGRLTSL